MIGSGLYQAYRLGVVKNARSNCENPNVCRRFGILGHVAVATIVFISIMFSVRAEATGIEVEWTLVKDQDGIQVYARQFKDSAIREVRAVTHIPVDANAVASMLANPSLRQKWQPNCSRAYLYGSTSADEQIIYYSLDMPWPVENRDVVMSFKWNRDAAAGGHITITGTSMSGLVPTQKGYVRITEAIERWDLISDKKGGMTVQLTSHADPGGPIPAWLINSLSVDMPFGALSRLKTLAERAGNELPSR